MEEANRQFVCGKKTDYKSKETAWKSANQMNEKGVARNVLEAYRCKYCQGWHIGRKKTLKKRIMKILYWLLDLVKV